MRTENLKDEINYGYDGRSKHHPVDTSDSDEKPFFLVKVPTLIDPEELEDIPSMDIHSNTHSDVLNKGRLVYIFKTQFPPFSCKILYIFLNI